MPIRSENILDQLRPSILRIETRWLGGGASATGFVVARTEQLKRLVVVTAKHVLDFPVPVETQQIVWTVQQFDRDGTLTRQLKTATPTSEMQIHWHTVHDVGFCVLPTASDDGAPFGHEGVQPLKCIQPTSMAPEGAKVAWSGYAGIIEEYLGHPQLCYFEGSVSATSNRAGRPIYIVDGHSARGVSGGPLWVWREDGEYNVIGIMSSYQGPADGLPGFCVFEPIQHVSNYLEWANKKVREELNSRGVAPD